jgi:hypothetical protein
MIRIPPPHRGHTRGSTSYTSLVGGADARFAAELETSLKFSMVEGPS